MSPQTWTALEELDYDQEQANIAAYKKAHPEEAQPTGGPAGAGKPGAANNPALPPERGLISHLTARESSLEATHDVSAEKRVPEGKGGGEWTAGGANPSTAVDKKTGDPKQHHGPLSGASVGGYGTVTDHAERVTGIFSRAIMRAQKEGRVTKEQRASYVAAFKSAAQGLPPETIAAALMSVKGIEFYGSPSELTAAVYPGGQHRSEAFKFGDAAAAWDDNWGILHLDGGPDAAGTYAHELSHAADANRRFSNTGDWRLAWMGEIVPNKPLSDYATTNPHEGWAEFGRLMADSRMSWSEKEKLFPQSFAVWRKNGLVK
jgi:hypothetical protein